jgi:hypothetical protein
MSMYVGAVILRRCQGVMPYDVKFHNDISEMIWQEVDLTWLSYYSSICMDDLRKPQITSFVADVRFDCPMVFWIEGKFCIYVTDFDVSTGPFFLDREALKIWKYLKRGAPTQRWLVPRWMDTNKHTHTHTHARTYANIFLPMRYVRWSHSHENKDLLTFRKRNFRKSLPEDDNLIFHHKFIYIIICTISVHSRTSRPALRPTQSSTH